MPFTNPKEIKAWVAQPESRSHPNYAQVHDETFLILALESQLHNHPLFEAYHRLMVEKAGGFVGMIKSLMGDELADEVQREASKVHYKVFLQDMRRRKEVGKLPPEFEFIDLEKETYNCPVDIEILERIKGSITICNQLVYYEV